ncbi:GNAT family N-acetyltransferase [Cumulibacter soli]|uniref:GNAT family N-acetyltransferase n=1 Tax=Cumulibacter soli TaxID=2546344 RepID=UPI0010689CDB|nr:GNAT family protein [Cumulibacter soli]
MLDPDLLPLRNDQAVVLRAMRAEDARAYAEGAADASVRKFAHLPDTQYTEASVVALIRGAVSEGLKRGDLAVLAIGEPATGEFAGSLVLFNIAAESVEVGFWIHPAHRGKGLSGAAISLALVLAQRSGFTRLTARTTPENLASQRVLEHAGFTRGSEARDLAPSGEAVVLLHYSREICANSLVPLETERLRLRLHEPEDSTWLHRLYSQASVVRYLLDEPWSHDVAVERVSERLAKTDLDTDANALALVIEHDGEPIGDVLLWLVDADRRVAEIGWVLDPIHSGEGFAREAVRAVLQVAFDHYHLHRVAAQMDARNAASAKLAAAVGMRHEAHLRQDWWSKGEWTDTLVFGMLASDR